MERFEKLELIQRSLGIRHKLKVHESMKPPESHEEIAVTLIAKWELEDELRAIEELLSEERLLNVRSKRNVILKKSGLPPSEADSAAKEARKKPRK